MACWSAAIPWENLTCFPKFQWVVWTHNFRSVRRLQEFWQTSLRPMWRLRFTRIRLNQLSGKILYYESVLVIVSWFGLCDQPLSSHQTFRHEVELRQCLFCKEPLLFWFSSIRRNFGLSGSEYKYCTSLISLPLSLDVVDLIPENCVRMQAILCLSDSLWSPGTNKEDLPAGRPKFSCHPSCFGFGFSGNPAPDS